MSRVSTSAGATDTLVHSEGPRTPAHTDGWARHEQAPLRRGASVGRYVVLETLGTGGMGIVYAAFDPELDRKIALKLLRPGTRRDPELARARLLREAQTLAKLSHPSVITVHDVGTYEDQVFVAMEFVDGCDMGQWLREQPRGHEELLPLLRMAGEGLAAAHAAGLVHRDFKPENVLVGRDGRVRVVDFGLARTADDEDAAASGAEEQTQAEPEPELDSVDVSATHRPSQRLTEAGAVMGTPRYMAPEQHRGTRADARSDQFSFCVALYEALYREHPFAGETVPQIAYSVLSGRIREPSRDAPPVPAWLRRVVVRGLSVEPETRWPDMQTLLAALGGEPVRRTRLAMLGGLGVVAVLASAWIYASDEGETCRGAERRLVGVWDDDVRTRLEQAFAAIERPYARDAFASTRDLLDAYASRWIGMHTEACRATAIRRERSQELLDRQMICLERRLKDVGALVSLLLHADEGVVEESVRAATRLPPLAQCDDLEALMAETPLTGAQAERVAQIEDDLATARNLLHLARYDEGIRVARAAVEAARVVEHEASLARALLLLGRFLNQLAQTEEAEQAMLEAVWTADSAGDDLVRADAWKDLIWVVGVRQQRYAEAALMPEHATRALRRAGGSPEIEAELHNNLGVLARRKGDDDAAIEHHRKALSLRRAQGEPDDPRLADSLVNLANALGGKDRLDEADAAMAEAQQIIEHQYGPRHPRMASALHSHGVLAYRRADYAGAVDLLRAATEIRRSALGPDHPEVAGSLHDLGEALLRLGAADQAIESFARSVELRETALGPDHLHLANSLAGLGLALLELRRPAEAAPALERALRIREDQGGDPLTLAETQFALARALADAPASPQTDPDRPLALAEAARDAYAASGKHAATHQEIETWLVHRR